MARIVELKPKKNDSVKEEVEQRKFVTWLGKNGIVFYAIPNGGKRNAFEGYKLKLGGVQSGVPDLCIPFASGPYHGLYIEIKRKDGGKVSDSQKYWIDKLNKNGYCAAVANGFEEAQALVLQYLALTPKAA